MRILVVDDEGDNREVMGIVLGWEGFVVATAASGEEALAAVGLHLPDLILLDVMMPGLDGYEVASRMKANVATRGVPIIIFTAVAEEEARLRARGCGADDALAKPIGRAELVNRVTSLLRATYADYRDAVKPAA